MKRLALMLAVCASLGAQTAPDTRSPLDGGNTVHNPQQEATP